MACFNGDYPIPFDAAFDKLIMERRKGSAQLLPDQSAQPALFDPKA
jgi:hypothetical protein